MSKVKNEVARGLGMATTEIAVKIYDDTLSPSFKTVGEKLNKIVEIATKIERIVSKVEGAINPYAERTSNRPYFEIEIDREQAARYGIKVGDIQHIIMTATQTLKNK